MAQIVLGLGVSHGPLLDCPPELWEMSFAQIDRKNPLLWFRKKNLTYDELVEKRSTENLKQYLALEETTKRHTKCIAALAELRAIYDAAKPDLLVIIGNDHREVFTTVTPMFGIYWGDKHENGPVDINIVLPGGFDAGKFYTSTVPMSHPGTPELGLHVIEELRAKNFDLASICETPTQGTRGQRAVPHAFGFVYHHLLRDHPPPSLPVHINTFYPPNQPPMKRVIDFAEALVGAIESWKSDLTVAIVGSGGLTHFVVDEQLDRRLLDIFSHDIAMLTEIDELYYQSGTSEVKNWVPAAVAMKRLKTPMRLIDYVPCYRSIAGTGQGMAFAYWRPEN